jgi:polyhydroxyalkanoate synthesis regulator phasin
MIKKEKTTEKLEKLLNIVARNVAEIKGSMATKADIADMATKADIADMATKADITILRGDLETMERRLTTKIEAVDEKIDVLEESDVRDLQKRVYTLEKDVKHLKHKHV